MSRSRASIVRKIGALKPHRFEEAVNAAKALSPETVASYNRGGSDAYAKWTLLGGPKFRLFCRKFEAKALAHEMRSHEAIMAHKVVAEIRGWLAEFEAHLP
jgi:hypothetical protein